MCRVDGICVGPRVARGGGDRVRNLFLFRGLYEQFEHRLVDRGSAGQHRAATELEVTELFLLDVGMVGGVRDIDYQGDRWLQRSCAGAGATARPGYFLLRSGNGIHRRTWRIVGEEAERLEHHESADTVVDAARCDASAGKLFHGRVEYGWVAHANTRQCVSFGFRTDVDPQIGDLRSFVSILLLYEMDRFLSYHSGNRTVTGRNDNTLSYQNLRVPSTDGREEEKAVVVNVDDHEPYLIDVPRKHHAGGSLRIDHCLRVALDVSRNFLSESFGLGPPNPSRCGLESRGPGSIE